MHLDIHLIGDILVFANTLVLWVKLCGNWIFATVRPMSKHSDSSKI